MIRGLYTAASGMLVEQIRTDVVANNLANVDTVGFKRDATIATAFPELLLRRIDDQTSQHGLPTNSSPRIGRMGTGVALEGTFADLRQGAFQHTGRPLDVALVTEGFFALENGEGMSFTRDGRLHVTAEGWLTDASGRRVLGVDGPIAIHAPGETPPASIVIGKDGMIEVDGEQVGQLAMYTFDQPAFLRRLGDNMWEATDAAGEINVQAALVEAEHVEKSNVNVVSEMVKMIQVQRAYETNQRVIQTHDETLGRAVNDIASY